MSTNTQDTPTAEVDPTTEEVEPSSAGQSEGQAPQPVAKYDPKTGRRIWPRGPGGRKVKLPIDLLRAQERQARRQKVLDLRIAGRPNAEIARLVGISERQVKKDLDNILSAQGLETNEHARKVSVARRERELGALTSVANVLAKEIEKAVQAGKAPSMDDLMALAKLSLARGRHMTAIENMTVPPLPQRVEHTGARGGPINIAALPDDQLRDLVLSGLLPGLPRATRGSDVVVEGETSEGEPAPDGGDADAGVLGAGTSQGTH